MSKVTIKYLANELGLSVSTISKALKDSYEISAETKAKVIELANKLHFVPNPHASSLRRQKSKTIAVVIPEVADSFFALAINGIESVAQQKGYHVLIYLTHEKMSREEVILNEFKSGRVDGILISVTKETSEASHIKEAVNSGLPIVFFDRVCEEVITAKVTTDDFESSYKATKHLISKSCKRIGYLSISKSLLINRKREEGYRQALIDSKFGIDEKLIIEFEDDEEKNLALLKKILSGKNKPDGLIASVEKLVPTVYQACKEKSIRIPDQLKLICFTNLSSSSFLDPPLSTITQPAFEMGKSAATLLFKGIEKHGFNLMSEKIIVPSSFHKRKSTDF